MSTRSSANQLDDRLATALGRLLRDLPPSLWTAGDIRSEVWDAALLDPAHDIVGRSGKGFRSRLLEHSWVLAGGDSRAMPELLPLTIELLHVGSLVIDDIEDDSSQRRGEPTLHRRYGLPLALNTGNWLYFLAFALISRLPFPPTLRLALYEDVSLALLRCHQGQALDISTRVTALAREVVHDTVETTSRLKTGALMGLASSLGARGAGASPQALRVIRAFGTEMGVGLQMLDDWSGITVEARKDKGVEDLRLSRPTWPWAWLSTSGDQVTYAETVHKARNASLDWEWERLRERLQALLGTTASAKIRDRFERVESDLRDGLEDSRALEAVHVEIDALVRAYG